MPRIPRLPDSGNGGGYQVGAPLQTHAAPGVGFDAAEPFQVLAHTIGQWAHYNAKLTAEDAALDVEAKADLVKAEYGRAKVEFEEQQLATDTPMHPDARPQYLAERMRNLVQAGAGSLKYPQYAQKFYNKVEPWASLALVDARMDAVKAKREQTASAGELADQKDVTEYVHAPTAELREAAMVRIEARDARLVGLQARKESQMPKILTQVARGTLLKRFDDPTDNYAQRTAVMTELGLGEHPHIGTPEQQRDLRKELQTQIDSNETRLHTQFTRNSEAYKGDLYTAIRETGDYAANPAPLNALEKTIQLDRLKGEDRKEIYAYIDLKKKAVKEDDMMTRSNARALIDKGLITNHLELLAVAANRLKTETVDSLQAHMASLQKEKAQKLETENDRQVAEAKEAGRRALTGWTTVTGPLGVFDTLAQQTRAQLQQTFDQSVLTMKSAGEINALTNEYVKRARVTLANQLIVEARELRPILGKYDTEEKIKQAFRNKEITQAEADLGIEFHRYIAKLTGAEEETAKQETARKTQQQLPKAAPTVMQRLGAYLQGQAPLQPEDEKKVRSLSDQVMKDLFPTAAPQDVTRDPIKQKAVQEEVIRRLRDEQAKSKAKPKK